MNVENMVNEMKQLIAQFEKESQAYQAQVDRGTEVFESSRAASFYDGKAEALSTVLKQLESLRSEPSEKASDRDSLCRV